MFCKYCGTQLPDGTKFCAKCGKQLTMPTTGTPVNSNQTMPSNRPEGAPTGYQAPTGRSSAPKGPSYVPPVRTQAAPAAAKIKVKKSYNIGNFIYWAGCLIAILSLFLDYASVSALGLTQSVSLSDTDDGMIFLVLLIIAAVINLFRLNIVNILYSCFTMFFVIMEYTNAKDRGRGLIKFNAGCTLLTLGTLIMIAAAITGLVLWNKKKRAAHAAQI